MSGNMPTKDVTQHREERFIRAVKAGCSAAERHLRCSYPECGCKQTPQIVLAAVNSWDEIPS
jgi:hypothetical protein